MITGTAIVGGAAYLTKHLQANDYWAEGEKEVEGEWLGEGAAQLGLAGPVSPGQFEALRSNLHPVTGEPLTSRHRDDRIVAYDFQVSAPKDVSILALVGGDDRVRDAFVESVNVAFTEFEKLALVRIRSGEFARTNEAKRTGNLVTARYIHDASRDLDPQLHAHLVTFNATFDPDSQRWFALLNTDLFKGSAFVRQAFYRDLARRLESLGYQTHSHDTNGFAVSGIEHLRERYSKRAQTLQRLKQEYRAVHGQDPTAKEVWVMVKDSRSDKLAEITTAEVRQAQLAELSPQEAAQLTALVDASRKRSEPVPSPAPLHSLDALQRGLDHIFERQSTAKDYEILEAALRLSDGYVDPVRLRESMRDHEDLVPRGQEFTLRSIVREETKAVDHVTRLRGAFPALASPTHMIPAKELLTREQFREMSALARSRDGVTILIGDAGTGKTRSLEALQQAHLRSGGQPWIALAPNTRGRDSLTESGFVQAMTVARFLLDAASRDSISGRTILVDEGGMLSTKQLAALVDIAAQGNARMLVVGDAKQHDSIERGNALRNLIEQTNAPVARLQEVHRQVSLRGKAFSKALAGKEFTKAFQLAEEAGKIREIPHSPSLFESAAQQYADRVAQGKSVMVIIPTWAEIGQFNDEARRALRARGLLGTDTIQRASISPLSRTGEEKTAWHLYKPGEVLTFHKAAAGISKGETVTVGHAVTRRGRLAGIEITRADGTRLMITKKQAAAFEVGERRLIEVAAGDRILFRGNHRATRKTNGTVATVASVNQEGEIRFTDGTALPPEFGLISHGHAITSHKSQGASEAESILVMGPASTRIANPQQFYVSNTRFRTNHTLYISDKTALVASLRANDRKRELAREFIQRTRTTKGITWRPAAAARGLASHLVKRLPSHLKAQAFGALAAARLGRESPALPVLPFYHVKPTPLILTSNHPAERQRSRSL